MIFLELERVNEYGYAINHPVSIKKFSSYETSRYAKFKKDKEGLETEYVQVDKLRPGDIIVSASTADGLFHGQYWKVINIKEAKPT